MVTKKSLLTTSAMYVLTLFTATTVFAKNEFSWIEPRSDHAVNGILEHILPDLRIPTDQEDDACEVIISLDKIEVLSFQGVFEGDLELRSRTQLFRLPSNNLGGGVLPNEGLIWPPEVNPYLVVGTQPVTTSVEFAAYQMYRNEPATIAIAGEVVEIDDFTNFGDDTGMAAGNLDLSCDQRRQLDLDVTLFAGHVDFTNFRGTDSGFEFTIETGSAPDGTVRLSYVAQPHRLRSGVLDIIPGHRQVNFQNVVVGDSRLHQVHIVNPTASDQRVVISGFSGNQLFWQDIDKVLPPLSSTSLAIIYSPTSPGSSRATMDIRNTSTGEVSRIRIRGRAIDTYNGAERPVSPL